MKDQLRNLFQARFGGKIARSSWHRIPSVSQFKVITGAVNELLQDININLKLPPKLIITKTKIDRANRYMEHQILRIRKAIGDENPQLAWVIAVSCIERSISFRASAMNYVLRGWFFKIPLWELTKIVRRVETIVRQKYTKMDFHRVYIPKANGKIRPLGVPTKEWRVVLHMINNMNQILTEKHIGEHQHGFVPGRGTMTAWMDILKNVINSKYIYETDLKGFFDNISTATINKFSGDFDIAPILKMWMFKINQSKPKFPKMLKMDESRFNVKNTPTFNRNDWLFADEMQRQNFEERPTKHVFKYLMWWQNQFPKVIGQEKTHSLEWENWGIGPGGVPQGAPTSPYLSILPLGEMYLNQQNHVNYADDQIFYGEEEFEIKDNPTKGIIHNESKCGWIKKDGVWLSNLRFLGLEYDYREDNLKTATRSGDKKTSIPERLMELIKEVNYDGENDFWKVISERNFFGFIQSCLYNGNWENKNKDTFEKLLEREQKVNANSFLGKLAEDRYSSSTSITLLMDEIQHRKLRCKLSYRRMPHPLS